jgi:hypothetical protein
MNILHVHTQNGSCTITTDTGRFDRWPGRQLDLDGGEMQWWSYTPATGSGPVTVTVAATVHHLEDTYLAARGPAVRHLRLVKGAA